MSPVTAFGWLSNLVVEFCVIEARTRKILCICYSAEKFHAGTEEVFHFLATCSIRTFMLFIYLSINF